MHGTHSGRLAEPHAHQCADRDRRGVELPLGGQTAQRPKEYVVAGDPERFRVVGRDDPTSDGDLERHGDIPATAGARIRQRCDLVDSVIGHFEYARLGPALTVLGRCEGEPF